VIIPRGILEPAWLRIKLIPSDFITSAIIFEAVVLPFVPVTTITPLEKLFFASLVSKPGSIFSATKPGRDVPSWPTALTASRASFAELIAIDLRMPLLYQSWGP